MYQRLEELGFTLKQPDWKPSDWMKNYYFVDSMRVRVEVDYWNE
jgi:hypothetical protein